MTTRSLTIGETIDEIRTALKDYIEATYHISNAALVQQRSRLLDESGVIHQEPFIESTPRYLPGDKFESLGIPDAAITLLQSLAQPRDKRKPLLYDPPYRHQAKAIESAITEGKSLVITTATGSGKTESFLLPILLKLAIEAQSQPNSFAMPAVRALLLYPMNALVNDQLGRLRLMFGDSEVADAFIGWAGRPARFARYTSRTLYPGVRTAKKDQEKLKSIGDFYVELSAKAHDTDDADHEAAVELIETLRDRGKWPAKPDLRGWYGRSGQRWLDSQGNFQRAVVLPGDSELLTRHEVLTHPPDILVTNYSMLEYMLMRPLERPVFERTREWLKKNPGERLLLIVDEAHLYRGAAGAEVGLLLRRFRDRLDLPNDRLQVICTSASFSSPDKATQFAADLCGKKATDFEPISGELALRPAASVGNSAEALLLAAVPLQSFYNSKTETERRAAVSEFLAHRGINSDQPIERLLFEALHDYPPMSRLVNSTMQEARPLAEVGTDLFPGVEPAVSEPALTALIALGSVARPKPGQPGLLPCRVHCFFRGLPGIWACLDEACSARSSDLSGSPVGAIYSQPRDLCHCGARVFELYTCRNCGAAYARAYTDNVESPSFLWAESGSAFESSVGRVEELQRLDLLLEPPTGMGIEPADLDLVTGRLNPEVLSDRVRGVFLKPKQDRLAPTQGEDDSKPEASSWPGEFRPCGVCGQQASFGRTSVQDHQTKGDEPFQALITRQLQVQAPSSQEATEFAPLRGRKILTFSDSRQTAARLAPNLQNYSMRDALRPLILRGWHDLASVSGLSNRLSLDDLYLSVLLASQSLGVRLRPKLKGTESLHVVRTVHKAIESSALSDPMAALDLVTEVRSESPPESLLRALNEILTNRHFGLLSLALASVRERGKFTPDIEALPALSVANSPTQKVALVRMWIRHWADPGYWFRSMNLSFWKTPRGVRPHPGKFQVLKRWIEDAEAVKAFEKHWLPTLLEMFTEHIEGNKYRILAQHLALELDGSWGYCQACRSTQRLFPGSTRCAICCRSNTVQEIDPDSDPVFAARKGYYRASSLRVLSDPPEPPMALIAAEHTAQLGSAQAQEVFSRAEQYELLFQDLDTGLPAPGEQPRTAVDVLSCTTTMEVGIDIGTLSGVALRNMPPARSSYQQRAGRAGRRGNAVATVLAFGSADSHDEQYFREPDSMVRGKVEDPILTLDNAAIARRHVTAYLFQRYHEARLPSIDPEEQPHLFEVLGTIADFQGSDSALNRTDFETWLCQNETDLQLAVNNWLPVAIASSERQALLNDLVDETLRVVDDALPARNSSDTELDEESTTDSDDVPENAHEAQAEVGEEASNAERAAENLLDRLLYKGILPRYAFPTDVVSFHVFDRIRYTRFRPAFEYAPSQGLPVALTQYAPGKDVWIDGKLWTSGALYSPLKSDLYEAWRKRRLYFECRICRYASTASHSEADLGEMRDCPACGGEASFGAAKNWIRPPGFAHPQNVNEGTSPEDQPAKSYATRAKLVAEGPSDPSRWQTVTPRLRQYYHRTHLLVTNSGPRREGYSYCVKCGAITPTASPTSSLAREHPKPYPDEREPNCSGSASTRGLVLGTDFISDVLLVGLQVQKPLTLHPRYLATDVALRTVCEAITIAAAHALEIEASELQAEYRPALTPGGHTGAEAEIYIYDTLAGGAGFAQRIDEMGQQIFERTLELLEDCPSGCDHSCYRCLRSFKNRFEHDVLDRHVGASLLRYLISGDEPGLAEVRLEASTDRLFADLCRHGAEGVDFQRRVSVQVAGLGKIEAPILARHNGGDLIVGLHAPLTPDHAADKALMEVAELSTTARVRLVDEIFVSRHLPYASRLVLEAVGK